MLQISQYLLLLSKLILSAINFTISSHPNPSNYTPENKDAYFREELHKYLRRKMHKSEKKDA